MLRDRFGQLMEPNEDEHIINYDWQGEPIWNYEADQYFETDDGYVLNDDFEIRRYMKSIWGAPRLLEEDDYCYTRMEEQR